MPRSWAELLGEENARPDAGEGGGGMFARLRDSLGRSRRALTEQMASAPSTPATMRRGSGSRRR
jgi:hypothetical protein